MWPPRFLEDLLSIWFKLFFHDIWKDFRLSDKKGSCASNLFDLQSCSLCGIPLKYLGDLCSNCFKIVFLGYKKEFPVQPKKHLIWPKLVSMKLGQVKLVKFNLKFSQYLPWKTSWTISRVIFQFFHFQNLDVNSPMWWSHMSLLAISNSLVLY